MQIYRELEQRQVRPTLLEQIAHNYISHLNASPETGFFIGKDDLGIESLHRRICGSYGSIRVEYEKSLLNSEARNDDCTQMPEAAYVAKLLKEYNSSKGSHQNNGQTTQGLLDAFARGPTIEMLVQRISSAHSGLPGEVPLAFEAVIKCTVGMPPGNRAPGLRQYCCSISIPVDDIEKFSRPNDNSPFSEALKILCKKRHTPRAKAAAYAEIPLTNPSKQQILEFLKQNQQAYNL